MGKNKMPPEFTDIKTKIEQQVQKQALSEYTDEEITEEAQKRRKKTEIAQTKAMIEGTISIKAKEQTRKLSLLHVLDALSGIESDFSFHEDFGVEPGEDTEILKLLILSGFLAVMEATTPISVTVQSS
jgi:hypothetical protein